MATDDNKGQEELLDYEEDEEALVDAKVGDDSAAGKDGAAAGGGGGAKKGHYVGIHASGFRDFLLKPELLRAVVDCGFEHPSEVQHECIPQAILGVDIVCQAKSGMGKTAVFVLATLHQLNPQPGEVSCLVLCHTRELAWQIAREYERFCKHLPEVKVAVLYGGLPVQKQREMLKNDTPHIVVGCPGRVMQLVREGDLKVDKLQYFVLDECDKMLDQKDMRAQVQEIFFKTPHTKQVMMFSATLSPEVRPICRKFCHDKPMEIYVDDETKLTLHGLQQYYIKLAETEKNRKLNDLLDLLDFNQQVVIFCSKVDRAVELDRLLNLCNFPSLVIHSRLKQEERCVSYCRYSYFEAGITPMMAVFLLLTSSAINPVAPDACGWSQRQRREEMIRQGFPKPRATMGVWRLLDLYPKIPTDLSQSTIVGGWFSTITGVVMLLLFQVELFSFMSAPIESQIVVDNVLETKKKNISGSTAYLPAPFFYLTVDALDILGSNRVNISGKEVHKWHLDPQGVKQAFHGRNRQQKDILQYDEKIKSDLEQDLHRNGVHAVPLTEANFDTWTLEHDMTFVAFHAPWCGWCKRLMPTLEVLAELMEESGQGVSVATVDCTVEKKLCTDRFSIRAFPTLKLFKEDKLQSPDYGGDRTVNAFSAYLQGKADGVVKSKAKRRANKEVGLHDDKWPGCMVTGHIMVNRVPGNFHVEAASNSHTFHGATTNLSHIVHHMSFGEDPPKRTQTKINRLPEDLRQNAPLDGNVYIAPEYHQAPHHYVRVVGATYQLTSMKRPWHGYQMVANSQMMLYDEEDVPEARFAYNISPMSVLVRSEKRPWYDFVTKVLAIVGGTFSVVGLVDAAVFRASRKAGRQLK
ncbi:unnamed protein product [Scytosiphon promiscuus]